VAIPFRNLILALLAALATGSAAADSPTPIESLRAKFPGGIPWSIEILDSAGKNVGSLDMRITSEPAQSCLGEMTNGVRVEFTHTQALPPTLHVAAYGVATFSGDRMKIDLTGGMCDAYVLMSGQLAPDGSSTGEIYTLGLRGGHDIGTYRATVK